jgi:hypothetical protein
MVKVADVVKGIEKQLQTEQNLLEPVKVAYSAIQPVVPNISNLSNHVLNPAAWAYERIIKYIREFEDGLDENHEVGARLVSFGQTLTFHIEDMGYHGPDIITFYGIAENEEHVQLIQHISQLSVLLVAVKKLGKKAKRIGFAFKIDEDKIKDNT